MFPHNMGHRCMEDAEKQHNVACNLSRNHRPAPQSRLRLPNNLLLCGSTESLRNNTFFAWHDLLSMDDETNEEGRGGMPVGIL